MDYSGIVEALKQATLFDLYRLSVAINHLLDDPPRIARVRKRLKPGQTINYFEPAENRLIEARVIKLKRTRSLIENTHDRQQWTIPMYWVNLDEVNTDITLPSRKGLDRSQLKVGDIVGFQDNQNNDVYGKVIRLNQKTATIKTDAGAKWRVGYEWLYFVLDGERKSPHLIEDQIVADNRSYQDSSS
jgi:hypothetical protein